MLIHGGSPHGHWRFNRIAGRRCRIGEVDRIITGRCERSRWAGDGEGGRGGVAPRAYPEGAF